MKLKIFVTSCETGEEAWRTQEHELKRLYELSDKKYCLTDDPESADIILIGNVREENWGKKVLQNALISRCPSKCFSLTEHFRPLFVNHGIYTNNSKSIFTLGRVRTGSYTIFGEHHLNPYVQNHDYRLQNNEKKDYLLTFIGRNCHRIRRAIFALRFDRDDVLIEDSSNTFKLWSDQAQEEKRKRQEYYYTVLLRSKFSLCPRGVGTNSIRVFESMQLGVAPVIISDEWVFPKGPSWNEFSIILKRKHLSSLEKIVESYESSYVEMGHLARKAYESFFSEDVYFNYVIENCEDILANQLIPEKIYWKFSPIIIQAAKARFALSSTLSTINSELKLKSRLQRLFSRSP